MKFFNRYNHRKPVVKVKGVSLTDPQFADDCDIQKVLKKYGAINTPPPVPFADCSQYTDFSDIMNHFNDAMEKFNSQPAEIRARFGNSPEKFFDFVTHPDNMQELVKMGLAVPRKKEVNATDLLEKIVENTAVKSPEGQNG